MKKVSPDDAQFSAFLAVPLIIIVLYVFLWVIPSLMSATGNP